MLYRDLVQGRSMDTTYHEALSHGHDPDRNPRLMPYLRLWHDRIAEAFRSGSSIPDQPAGERATASADVDGGRK